MCVFSDSPSHTAAVIAAIFLLLLLGIAAVVYSRCHLNFKLWYKNSYGDYELNGEACRSDVRLFSCRSISLSFCFLSVCLCLLCPQMENYTMPISLMSTMIMTGSSSTLSSNLIWRIKMGTRCTSMTTISCLTLVKKD